MNKAILVLATIFMLVIPISSVIANQPPETPDISGPSSGSPGVEYNFTIMTNDPDNDDVIYFVNWGCCGDGGEFHEYGPFKSGVEKTLVHSYSEKGTFTIQAYAKDTNGAESDMTTLEIKMPKTKNNNDDIEMEWKIRRGFGDLSLDIIVNDGIEHIITYHFEITVDYFPLFARILPRYQYWRDTLGDDNIINIDAEHNYESGWNGYSAWEICPRMTFGDFSATATDDITGKSVSINGRIIFGILLKA